MKITREIGAFSYMAFLLVYLLFVIIEAYKAVS